MSLVKKPFWLSLLAILFLVSLRPSIIWSHIYVANYAFAIFAIILFALKIPNSIKKVDFIALVSLFIVLVIYSLVSGDLPIFNILLSLIILADDTVKEDGFKYCHTALAILFASSLIVTALLFLQISIPSEVIDPPYARPTKYLQYPFLAIEFYEEKNFMMPTRFASVFDEPGVVGTLSVIFLVLDKFNFKKWQNFIYLSAGILSFSFFFYAMVLIYYPFFTKIKNSVGFIIAIVLLFPIIKVLEVSTDGNQLEHVFDRFEFKNGHFIGDNRSTPTFDQTYDVFWNDGSDVLFGKGIGAHNLVAPGIQTYKMIVYDMGLIYVLASLFYFILYGGLSMKRNKKMMFLYILLIMFFYYNRSSYLFTPPYFFLLTIAPILLQGKTEKITMTAGRKP